jgi:hypothetical protein
MEPSASRYKLRPGMTARRNDDCSAGDRVVAAQGPGRSSQTDRLHGGSGVKAKSGIARERRVISPEVFGPLRAVAMPLVAASLMTESGAWELGSLGTAGLVHLGKEATFSTGTMRKCEKL